MLRPGGIPHPPMLQEGEKALKEEVEGEEGTIEAEGEVVLLSVDELVAFTRPGTQREQVKNVVFNCFDPQILCSVV